MDDLAQGPYAIAYRAYWAAGWSNVLPVHDGQGGPGKSHVPRGYTGQDGRTVSWPDLNAWAMGDEGRHNLGVRLVAMVGIDVDAHDGEQGAATLAKAEAELGPLPPTWSSTSRGVGPSRILFFRVPLEREAALRRREKVFNDTFGPNIEILHRGHRFAVCWPSVHPDTGLTYQWYGPDGLVCGAPPKRGDVPLLPDTWLDFLAPSGPLRTVPDMSAPSAPGGSLLFGTASSVPDYRTEAEAARILREAVQAFIALDADGRARRLLPALALTAGHGVPGGFWTAEQASTQIEAMGIACGYVEKHGLADLRLQVERGLRDGAATPWIKIAQPEHDAFASAQASETSAEDEVSALLAEMLTMDEMAEREPPRYMIKNLLSFDSETWLIGGPGSKKSFVAFDMAAHVALGRPWQGLKVSPGLVVFIVAEGGGGFGKRVHAWRSRYGNVPADRMRSLPRPVQAADLRAWAVLVAACRRLRKALDPALGMFIVVDTQARSTVGLDENKSDQIGVYIEALAALRKATGACVMSIHHTVKGGDTTRGSSALDGAQDTRLLMKSERGSLEARLIVDKQKDLEQIDDIELRFEKVPVGQDSDGEEMDSLVVLPADGWRSGLFGGDSAERLTQAQTPFAMRRAPEHWTHEITESDATVQRWLLQALADTAEDRGLTQAEWRELVNEKLGSKKPNATAWRKAFQRVTSSDPKFSEVVVQIHGADRWTVDKVAIEALEDK